MNILPEENIYQREGIELMKSFNDNSFDLILSLMFGPDKDGSFAEEFYLEANRIVKQSGRILIITDPNTLNQFEMRFTNAYKHKGKMFNLFIGFKQKDIEIHMKRRLDSARTHLGSTDFPNFSDSKQDLLKIDTKLLEEFLNQDSKFSK